MSVATDFFANKIAGRIGVALPAGAVSLLQYGGVKLAASASYWAALKASGIDWVQLSIPWTASTNDQLWQQWVPALQPGDVPPLTGVVADTLAAVALANAANIVCHIVAQQGVDFALGDCNSTSDQWIVAFGFALRAVVNPAMNFVSPYGPLLGHDAPTWTPYMQTALVRMRAALPESLGWILASSSGGGNNPGMMILPPPGDGAIFSQFDWLPSVNVVNNGAPAVTTDVAVAVNNAKAWLGQNPTVPVFCGRITQWDIQHLTVAPIQNQPAPTVMARSVPAFAASGLLAFGMMLSDISPVDTAYNFGQADGTIDAGTVTAILNTRQPTSAGLTAALALLEAQSS